MTELDVERRVAEALREDPVWARIRAGVAEPRPGRPPRQRIGWGIGVAAMVAALAFAVRHGSPPTAPRALARLQVVGPGPVVRLFNTNVEQIAAALATSTHSQPAAVYVSEETLGQVVSATRGTLSGLSPRERVKTVWVVGRVLRSQPPYFVTWAAGSTIQYSPGPLTSGADVAVYSLKGRLLEWLVADGVGPSALKAVRARRVWWPADWAYRLWAKPWWPALGPGKVVDPAAVSYVLIPRSEVSAFEWPPPAAQTLKGWRSLPGRGPVYLVESPSGQGWLVDGTTGQALPFSWAGGWFPLTHFGTPRPAPDVGRPAGGDGDF